jgi:hypothetical protein
MTDDLFEIPGEVVAAAEAQQSFSLVIPEHNVRRSRRDPKTALWMEGGVITSASMGSYTNEQTNQEVRTISFSVEINAEGSGVNSNRNLSTVLRINSPALKSGEPKGQVTMSLMSVSRLKQLLIALGIASDLPGGGYSDALLKHYFPKETDQFPIDNSPLVGHTIYFEVKQGPREMRDGSVRDVPEINKILQGGLNG